MITVNNAGGNITANSGSTVQLLNATVQGGTLNNIGGTLGTPSGYAATFWMERRMAPSTINGTYTSDFNSNTYLLGTINNNNNFQVNGGAGVNSAVLAANNVTLQGGGTVTLYTATGGGNAYHRTSPWAAVTLTNVNNTIQGSGIIGNNGLALVNNATINANSTGADRFSTWPFRTSADSPTPDCWKPPTAANWISTVSWSTTREANITANGASAYVQLYGNTVIQGGTLNNNGGAFFGTPTGYNAFLDGSTVAGAINLNGGYTSDLNSATYLLGTINNNHSNFQVNGGGGVNGQLLMDSSNVTLQGGGTVTLSTLTGGGNAYIEQAVGGLTLTNVDNTIQGDGIIGQNGLTLVNQATINANSTGGAQITTLTLQGLGGLTNTGLLEATNSGYLNINGVTVNNAGGNITANGASAGVQLFGNTVIQGGTLNNNGGAFFGTPTGYNAFLDGSTIAGPITINGTYTSDLSINHLPPWHYQQQEQLPGEWRQRGQ